jgi:glycine/D-amino acid oxidase-like deaminating enzyme
MATVIIGAGIIGCSTAYYLSESIDPTSIHLVESADAIFECASGRAGGFLARDWHSPEVAALGKLSFELHNSLSEQNDGYNKWGYNASTGISLIQGSTDDVDWLGEGVSRALAAHTDDPATGIRALPPWLNYSRKGRVSVISDGTSTAQV